MDAVVEQFEMFPEMPTAPLPKKVRNLWERMNDMRELTAKHGQLIPISAAAALMDLSRQRVYQLIDEGTLRPVECWEQKWLCENDIREFLELERDKGRPAKQPSVKEIWSRSHSWAKEAVQERRAAKRAKK